MKNNSVFPVLLAFVWFVCISANGQTHVNPTLTESSGSIDDAFEECDVDETWYINTGLDNKLHMEFSTSFGPYSYICFYDIDDAGNEEFFSSFSSGSEGPFTVDSHYANGKIKIVYIADSVYNYMSGYTECTGLYLEYSSIPSCNLSNPAPGDTSKSNQDLPYFPGSSFNSDAIENVAGVKELNKQGGKQYHVFPVVWLKTVPKTGNLNGAYHLEDISSGDAKLQKNTGSNNWTEYVTTRDKMLTFNFNPAIYISNDSYVKKLITSTSNLAQATIIGVWGLKSNYTTDQFLFMMQARNSNWTLFSKQTVLHSDNTVPSLSFGSTSTRNFMYQQNALEKTDTVFHEKSIRLGSYYVSNIPQNTVWGESQDASLFFGTKSDPVTAWSSFMGFQGYMPELLIFNHQLTQKQIQTYNSYLAIKYGLTLDTSYVSTNGEVIWNFPANKDYNNRITGYGREDDLGLMQKVSTTSYEESPYYSEPVDSHDLNDSYQPASRYRLLVMGLQPANPINNSRYVVFGDNGGPLKYDSTTFAPYKMLTRRWKLQTNTVQDAVASKNLTWIMGNNLQLYKFNATNQYRCDMIKNAQSDPSAFITPDTLKGKDGYLAWTVDNEYGPINVKFGTNKSYLTAGANDYGYSINENGQVYRIIKGVINPLSLFTVEKGQRLEIEKNEKVIYLKVNGVRYKDTEFLIDGGHQNARYYGAIIMGWSNNEMKLRDFRHGGFVNTGHRIELSYESNRASGFANPSIDKICLLIDDSGQGQFSGYNPNKVYPCDELDTQRKKIIFNNVFWDTSPNGVYYFTFAYKNSVTLRSWESDDENENEKEIKAVDDIQIYNSGHGTPQLTVRIKTAEMTPVDIQVFDLYGRLVEKEHLQPSLDVSYTDFRLPAKGIYIVKIATQFKLHTHQVISK